MIAILKVFKGIFKYSIIIGILLIISIQIPIIRNNFGNFILKKINENNNYKISIEKFDLKQLTTLELKNITILIDEKQNNTIKIEEMTFNINPITFFFNKEIIIKNIQLSNLKIELNNNNYTNNKDDYIKKAIINIKSKLNSFLINKIITLVNIKINNLHITYINRNKSENIINLKIKKLNLSKKEVALCIENISLENEYLNIFDGSLFLSYYINSDSLYANITKLSSSLLHYSGGILIKNITSILDKKDILEKIYVHTKIRKLILPVDNIKKIINYNFIKTFNDNIYVDGEAKLDGKNLEIKNFLISFANDTIILNSQIKNFDNKNSFNYNIQLINCKSLIEIINNFSKQHIHHFIKNEYINNINISISGNNNKSILYSNIETIIGNINLNSEIKTNLFNNKNIKDKFESIKININSKKIKYKNFQNITLHDISADFSYNLKTNGNDIKVLAKKISYNNKTLFNFKYTGKIQDKIIIGNITGKSNIFSFSAENTINIKSSSSTFNGSLSLLNKKVNGLEINSINSDFIIDINKTLYGFKINNILKNIKMFINNSEIKTEDIECAIATSSSDININLKTGMSNIKLKGLNINYLVKDIMLILNNTSKNNKNIFKNDYKYKTEISINFKKTPIFDLFFDKYFDINNIDLYILLERRNKTIENIFNLTLNDLFIYGNNISKTEIKQNINFSNIDNFSSDIFIKSNINKKTYTFKSIHKSTANILNNIANLTINNIDYINANFTFNKNKGKYNLSLDNIENYIRINSNKIRTTGFVTFSKNHLLINNFKIIDKKTKHNYVSIDSNIRDKIFDKDNKINISINNLNFKGISFKNFKNINFTLNTKLYDLNDKITLNVGINNIGINKKNYENIGANISFFKNNADIKGITQIELKYYNKIKTSLLLYGQIFSKNNLGYVLDLKLNNLDLTKINIFTKNVVKIKNGNISGNFNLYGDTKKININGNGNIENMSIYIKDNGCLLEDINADLYASSTNKIDIFSIVASQNKIKCGDFTGELIFNTPLDPHFIINGDFYNCNIFNKKTNNEFLNGTLDGNGNIKLEYIANNLLIDTNIKLIKGNIHIVPEINENQYKIFEKKLDIFKLFYKINSPEKTKLNLSMTLNINEDIDICIDINKFNQLKLNGKADLIIKKNNILSINGNYIIDKGTYNFNTYNIISKKFHINNGNIMFNNEISNTTINIDAISDKYTISENKTKNAYLGINLKGYLIHPEIEYRVILENGINNEYENKNGKLLIEYFFSNNTNNITLNDTITSAVNKIIIKNIRRINKNLIITLKSNVLELLLKKEIADISFKFLYNLNNKFIVEKTFSFDNYKNLYQNIELTFNANNNKFKDRLIFFNNKNNINKKKTVPNNILSNHLTFSHSF